MKEGFGVHGAERAGSLGEACGLMVRFLSSGSVKGLEKLSLSPFGESHLVPMR
jgi:hypothetical protein